MSEDGGKLEKFSHIVSAARNAHFEDARSDIARALSAPSNSKRRLRQFAALCATYGFYDEAVQALGLLANRGVSANKVKSGLLDELVHGIPQIRPMERVDAARQIRSALERGEPMRFMPANTSTYGAGYQPRNQAVKRTRARETWITAEGLTVVTAPLTSVSWSDVIRVREFSSTNWAASVRLGIPVRYRRTLLEVDSLSGQRARFDVSPTNPDFEFPIELAEVIKSHTHAAAYERDAPAKNEIRAINVLAWASWLLVLAAMATVVVIAVWIAGH